MPSLLRTTALALLLATSGVAVHAQTATPEDHTAHHAAAPTQTGVTYKVGDVIPGTLMFTDHLGNTHRLADLRGTPVVLEWSNYGCPFVRKHYDSGNMQKLQADYTAKGVKWVSVMSSAAGKQGFLSAKDAPGAVAKAGFKGTFVALDSQGTLGRAFGAEATPHMFVLDKDGKLVYSGAIDSIPSFSKADIAKADNYIADVLDELLAGKPVTVPSTRAYGCSVKY